MRVPAQTATGAGGRHADRRRGAISAPDAINWSRAGAPVPNGVSWATGRPCIVTTVG